MAKWIQKAVAKMEKKGTVGKFGKATVKKIKSAEKKGGVMKKRAVFAENMKKIAKSRKAKSSKKKFNGGAFESARKSYFGLKNK